MFGLTGAEGNHGEDVKEYWWYLDAVPSHAWNRWRYHYPQGAFPYDDLSGRERPPRASTTPSTSCSTPGAFDDDRYWIVEVDYAKADPTDLLMTIRVTNAGPEADTLHVLPTRLVPQHVVVGRRRADSRELAATAEGVRRRSTTRSSATLELLRRRGTGRDRPGPAVLRQRDQRRSACTAIAPTHRRTPRTASTTTSSRARRRSTPTLRGTKAPRWYQVEVAPGATVELRLRLRPTGAGPDAEDRAWDRDFDDVVRPGGPRPTSSTPS